MKIVYVSLACALFINILFIVCDSCRNIDSGCYQGSRLALGRLLAGPESVDGTASSSLSPGPSVTTYLISIGGYCLKIKISPNKYNYRLALSKMVLRDILQKGRKSLVFRYRDAFLLFLKRKVESRILFLISLSVGCFYYHSLRSSRKVESRKVSGDF